MRLKIFLDKVHKIILDHIDDEDFNVGKLAEYLNLSRSQTLRKIKAASGCSANEYIREVRLKKSIELMKNENLTISEISYRVGFNNPSYFNKCFHDKYHYAPGEFRDRIMNEVVTAPPGRSRFKSILLVLVIIIVILSLIWWNYVITGLSILSY